MKKIIVGKKYSEFLKRIYIEYYKNPKEYIIMEKSRFELYYRICPFCLEQAISGFIEMKIDEGLYNIHIDCIDKKLNSL